MQRTILKKYAVKTFDDIIGQQYIVSFFKNSLYKNIFYPLYLLAGMRGTGKTTSARLFAAAALCDRLSEFQKNSNDKLPCYHCDSCKAVIAKNHPDIIELDAASHTGVDTIRAVIDNAYVLPVLKEKKFYIIDEVHMLSKAAFNACLKIMEEPPMHVHFILATTEIQKVIDTIKSRSIILNFKPIPSEVLFDYLKKITQEQGIIIETAAIEGIIKIADYSVRDACNILEKLIIAHNNITVDILYEEYGYPKQELIEEVFDALLISDTTTYFQKKKFLVGVQSRKILFEFSVLYLQKLIQESYQNKPKKYDSQRLFSFLTLLYQYEHLFLTSESSLGLFDLLLSNVSNVSFDVKEEQSPRQKITKKIEEELSDKKEFYAIANLSSQKNEIPSEKEEQFINELGSVLSSIFKQGKIVIQEEKKIFEVTFKKNFSFYKDFLDSKQSFITEIIEKIFLTRYSILYYFKDEQQQEEIEKKPKKDEVAAKSLVSEKKEILKKTDNNNSLIEEQVKSEKKVPYLYEKKNKKGIHNEYLSAEMKKITSLFPGTTYIKEE
jgi:DNA polymerase III subunit gamma/tau